MRYMNIIPAGNSLVLFSALVYLTACSEVGERDNPLDPGADNYQASADSVYDFVDYDDSTQTSGDSKQSSNKSSSSNTKESFAIEDYLNPDISYGSFKDKRDGQSYKTVRIGNQVWMAQNLNYKTATSFCYNQDDSYCTKYGRLYLWAEVVGKKDSECGFGKECGITDHVQGICPEGWLMPTKQDWETLIKYVGGNSNGGKRLKAKAGWDTDRNGSDEYGFSVLPGGYRNKVEDYVYEGHNAYIWSSTENKSSYAHYVDFGDEGVFVPNNQKYYAMSVRCFYEDTSKVSSSSKESSSSSGTSLSSSSVFSIGEYLNPDLSYGEYTDTRDNQVYKTIKIGDQVWLAQNLNYAAENSFCYKNMNSKCERYGRIYTWESAQSVCPEKWRLPGADDYRDLYEYVGASSIAGRYLRSAALWGDGGTNDAGFSAIPAGILNDQGTFVEDGASYFWTTTESNNDTAWLMGFFDGQDEGYLYLLPKKEGFSVRCIEGALPSVQSSSSEGNSSAASSSSSSSSFSIVEYLNSNISYGEITDERDGQVYKTVKIGDQVWMAQNLNFEMEKSYCYGDKPENCTKLGRLYTWGAAMDSVGKYDDGSKGCGFGTTCAPRYYTGVRGVCPDGWHLPTKAEWDVLLDAVGGTDVAGKKLKSAKKGGSNDYGFSAVPSGRWCKKGTCDDDYAIWYWTSVEKDAYGIYPIHSYDDHMGTDVSLQKDYAVAVRCLQDYDVFGTLTDERDGQQYKTVKIGSQNWMAENLNYAYLQPTATEDSSSFCYDGLSDNCDKYGRLYLWSAAMDSAGLISNQGKGCGSKIPCDHPEQVQGVCPKGWHLPSQEEWGALLDFIGGRGNGNDIKLLKSVEGWTVGGNGSNSYGFNALPAGFKGTSNCSNDDYQCLGESATFWSSTEGDYEGALRLELRLNREENKNDYWVDTNTEGKGYAQSVRCIENK